MLIPIFSFLVIAGVVYLLGRQVIRPGSGEQPAVLVGNASRPLVFGRLTGALAGILPCSGDAMETLTRYLKRAGYYHWQAPEEFLSLRNAVVVGWVLLVGTVVVVVADSNHPGWFPLAAGCFGALLLYALPAIVLRSLAAGRLRRIQYTLPDALDMIAMTMTAGLPIQDSVRRVARDLKDTCPDLAYELQIVSRQGDLGSFEKALRQFALRSELPEIQSLAAMVAQAELQGSPVGDALEEFADGIRLGRRQRAEEQGNKTSVMLLLPLIFCLAPPVYILLLSPAVIEMRDFVLRENRPGGILAPESAVNGISSGSLTGRGRADAGGPLSPMQATLRRPASPASESLPLRSSRPGTREPVDLRLLPAGGSPRVADSGRR